ncbi:MAG: 1-aminocyclopropane-1-carboxylate deaminase [Bacteroidetes bacterium]|nr:MAG: 1-aminocyclopropane-1-carboxylate deaminase [Bacteroidota bacterium]
MQARIDMLNDERLTGKGISAGILRTDLLHEHYGGNKWYKLRYNLQAAKEAGAKTILTFGGAFSNHIAATAAAAKEHHFSSIGIIRGEATEPLNTTLSFAAGCGMRLHHVSREKYGKKNTPEFLNELRAVFGDFYPIPEGGSNTEGVRGCTEIIGPAQDDFDTVMLACGTGATLAGVALSLQKTKRVIGVPVFRNGAFLQLDVDEHIRGFLRHYPAHVFEKPEILLQCDYHFGGYARQTGTLFGFVKQFEEKSAIPLDYVYTSKLLFAFYDLAQKNFFRKGERILLVHSGGLQGNTGILRKYFGKNESI